MLTVEDLNAFYGDSQVLHAVSIEVADRERVAVIGRNGAGKSTLFKSILNVGPRTRGRIEWRGRNIGGTAAFRRVREGLCLVPEDRRIFGHITVHENIAMARYAAGDRVPIAADEMIARFPMLAPIRDRLGGLLSGGQQQMVAIARALAARPLLLMLDEPTEGLAPVIVEQLARDVAASCAENGAGLLLSEQNLWFARQCTERLYIIDSGQIVFSGNWAALDAEPGLKQRFLGV